MAIANSILALVPLFFPGWYLIALLDNPLQVVGEWFHEFRQSKGDSPDVPPVGSQLLAYVIVAVFGYLATAKLVPNIKVSSRKSRLKECDSDAYHRMPALMHRSFHFVHSNIHFARAFAGKTWESVEQLMPTNQSQKHWESPQVLYSWFA